MKDTVVKPKVNLTRRFLFPMLFCLINFVSAYAEMTCSIGDRWNGSATVEVVGNYAIVDAQGFDGTIAFDGVTVKNVDVSATRHFTKFYVNESKPEQMKIQTTNAETGKFCMRYDSSDQTIYVTDGGCEGSIVAIPENVCFGSEVNLQLIGVSSSDKIEWGVETTTGSVETLTDQANKISITYLMDGVKPVTFVAKVSSGGSSSQSRLTVYPTLENCGFLVTVSDQSVCLGAGVTMSTTYTSGTLYEWKDDKGNTYPSTSTPTATLYPREAGDYKFSVYADGLKVGTASVRVKSMADCGYTVTARHGYACIGGTDELSTNYTEGKLYTWKVGNTVVQETTTPSVKVAPTEPTTYTLYVDGYYVGDVHVDAHECTFFIASKFPVGSCLQDTNVLMAVGTAMLDDINNDVFEWSASVDSINWFPLGTSSYRMPVNVTMDMYFKVDYNGLSQGIFYPKPDCENQSYCDGLETKTLFYETFGFFLADDAYYSGGEIFSKEIQVNHKTTVRVGNDTYTSGDYNKSSGYFTARAGNASMSVDLSSTNNFSVRSYVAPDPFGYVVPATTFTNVGGANQFVGTNGHLYMTENPMLSQYESDSWVTDASLRLQDGYYAIVMSPDSCGHNRDNQDFITCSDYTGGKNGAMLFVNAGQTNVSKAAIYAQKASLACPADRFNFGMSVRNATHVDANSTSKNPVNLTICLLKEFDDDARTLPSSNNPNVLASLSSGDVRAGEDWKRLDEFIQLSEKVQDVWVVIYNNGEPGDGNDMLLDDITFSVCIPKADMLATLNGDTLGREAVSCGGEIITLHAFQTSTYLENPLYIFQYQKAVGGDTVWTDLMDYVNNPDLMKADTAQVSTKEADFWGTLRYRVIISDDASVIRKVADENWGDISECEFTYHQASTTVSIRNTYGGEMAPRDSVSFCNIPGTIVTIPGERILTVPDHEWTMSWLAADSTVVYTKDVKGVSKDSLTLTVLDGETFSAKASDGTDLGTFTFAQFDSLLFRAEDEGGCFFYQTIKTHAKMNLDIKSAAESFVDCNSVTVKIIRNYSEPSLVFDWSSVPGSAVVVDDSTQTFTPDNLEAYSTIEGKVKVTPVNVDDKYCFLQDEIQVPYTIHNGHYTMTISSSKDPVCVSTNESSYSTSILTLTAKVDTKKMSAAEAAKIDEKITSYKWHIEFSDNTTLDTITSTKDLSFTNRDLLNSELNEIKAKQLFASVVATTTDVCETVTHDPAESKIDVEIREGGFTLMIESVNTLCLLDENSHDIKITITPPTALYNINQLQLYMNGLKLQDVNNLKDSFSVTIDDKTYPSIFTAGNTATYKVSVYDSTCKSDNESNTATVKYNGYDWKFNEPDSCLTESNNLFNIIATIDSAKAVNHITSYKWTLNGNDLPNSTGLSYAYPVQQSMTGLFKLVTSDGICKDVEHEFTSNIAINYTVTLKSAKDRICSTDSAVISTVVLPETSRSYIKTYTWYVVDSLGNEQVLKAGGPEDSKLTLSKNNYEKLFTAGNSFSIYVVTDDQICAEVTSTEPLHFDVNDPFTLKLTPTANKVCYREGDIVSLNVEVSPSNAINHIPTFIYSRIGNGDTLSYSTSSTTFEISQLESWMTPCDDVLFTVSASDGICVFSNSPVVSQDVVDINTPFTVDLMADKAYACSKGDFVILKGTNSQSSGSYVTYENTFNSVLNGTTYTLKNGGNALYVIDTMDSYKGVNPQDILTYSLTVNDGNVCGPVTSAAVPVHLQTPFKAHIEASKYVVCKDEPFSVELVQIDPAGSKDYIKMYSWQEDGVGSVGELNKTLYPAGLAPGYHKFFTNISDGICYGTDRFPTLQSDTVSIKVHDPIIVSLSASSPTFCMEPTSSPVVITATSYSGEPVRYELYDAATNTLLNSKKTTDMSYSWDVYPDQTVNSYYAVVYDDVCPGAFDITGARLVDVHLPLIFDVTIPENDYQICLGETVHLTTTVTQGNPAAFGWYGLSSLLPEPAYTDQRYLESIPEEAGIKYYTIVATDFVCPDVTVEVGPIEVHEQPMVNLIASKAEVVIGSTVDFVADVYQGNPIIFDWMIEDMLLGTTPTNYLADFKPASSSTYTVFASDGVCPVTSSSVTIGVLMPTAFTPHIKDGMNDIYMEGYDVTIYDRYGDKVFEGNNGWNGMKGDVMADPGVYYVYVLLKDGKKYKGTVEIIKID